MTQTLSQPLPSITGEVATVRLWHGKRRMFVYGVMIDPNELWGGGKVDEVAERIKEAAALAAEAQ